jgi:hypothetical protein
MQSELLHLEPATMKQIEDVLTTCAEFPGSAHQIIRMHGIPIPLLGASQPGNIDRLNRNLNEFDQLD